MSIILKAEGISKAFQGEEIVKDISLTLKKGELVSLLGPSGVGKTTLFQMLSGLEEPDSGQIYIQDENVTGVSGKVGYMQQKDLLLPHKTVLDNVCIPLKLKGISKKIARDQALSHFTEFRLMGAENKYPFQISGGMRQRAALLRTYLFNGELLLLDEPFSALDSITKGKLYKWFREIMIQYHSSVFLITHDIEEAIFLSDRIYIMAGVPGKIQKEVQIHCATDRETFLLSEAFLGYKGEILKNLG